MRYFLFFLLASSNMGFCYAQSIKCQNSVIGSVYLSSITDLPAFKGYRENRSALLRPSEAGYGICLGTKGKDNILLLDTLVKDRNKIKFKVLAILKIGYIPKGQLLAVVDCRIHKKPDSDIIAVVKESDNEFDRDIVKAWKIDRSKHTIHHISTKDIDCSNDNYGL